MTPKEQEDINNRAKRAAELEALIPINFAELERRIKRWMLIADRDVIKFLCMIYAANHLPRDPIWVFLIAASGGGKTELVTSMFDLPDMYPLSLITPNTFLSGMPGRNSASLLPKISGKILAFLDWTNMMSMNQEAQAEILGQFRDIYGGYLKKSFGTGRVEEWKGKIGVLACTTSMVDFSQQRNAALGERFVHYRVLMPDRKEVGMRSLQNGGRMEEMRKDMRDAFFSFFKSMDFEKKTPELPDEVQIQLVDISNLATMARSGVIRESSFKREVIFVPAVEMPTRLPQQLATLACAAMVVNGGEYDPEDMKIIYKVALDSIPQTNRMVMLEMAAEDNLTTKEIATALGYPTAPIHLYLENLALLGVIKRYKGSDTEQGGAADRWALLPEFSEILRKYESVEKRKEPEVDLRAEAEAVFGGEDPTDEL